LISLYIKDHSSASPKDISSFGRIFFTFEIHSFYFYIQNEHTNRTSRIPMRRKPLKSSPVPPAPEWMVRRAERDRSYDVRLALSLLTSGILLTGLFALLPRRMPDDQLETKRVRVTSVSLLELIPSVDSRGGGGGTSEVPLPRIPALPGKFNPVKEVKEDTSLIFPGEIKEDFGSGGGSGGGEGTGIGTGKGSGIGSGYEIEIQPQPIWEVVQEYPESEKKRGIRGLVELDLLVNTEGLVDSVRVVRNETLNRNLELAAIRAARGSRYLPVMIDGKPIAVWFHKSYSFGEE
jgi:TonB family protein